MPMICIQRHFWRILDIRGQWWPQEVSAALTQSFSVIVSLSKTLLPPWWTEGPEGQIVLQPHLDRSFPPAACMNGWMTDCGVKLFGVLRLDKVQAIYHHRSLNNGRKNILTVEQQQVKNLIRVHFSQCKI